MEGDDEIKEFLVFDTLPQAKKALQKIFEEKLEEIQHLKLRDLTMQALDEIGKNPLGASFDIKAKETAQYESIVRIFGEDTVLTKENRALIDKVNYDQNKEVIERLSRIISGSRALGFGITLIACIIAIIITFNTIRLTMHFTKEEIKTLEEKGYTYRTYDGIYFDTSKFKAYKAFANLDVEGLKSGARVEENKEKKHITDFALWKFSPKDEKRQMEWESPWGVGFPGWHIECSAMAMKYLGEHFDIHTGGIDHIKVHHTNEIAQSECATGVPYVTYWMHNNHLLDTTGKMSKSNGDFMTLSKLREENYNPLAYRYFLLTAHYRKELSFSYEALSAASTAFNRLVEYVQHHASSTGNVIPQYMHQAHAYINDDLSTPEVIALLWKLMKDQDVLEVDRYMTVVALGDLLGLGLREVTQHTVSIPDTVSELLAQREEARKRKDFALSDSLRKEIESHGFSVKDTPEGQVLSVL
jgi:cysteinyl-tRNA synthetase